jgi:DNA replicative helicase MCM subunit Mcm2 (Cdc46/Mcm family)
MPRLKPELVDHFEDMATDTETEMVEELWPHVHSDMAAMERARKAVLLTLASHSDQLGRRGRCHTLLVGPPGTGKTELRNWVKYNIAAAHGIGPKASEAGLKGDFSKDPPEPGALNMAHGGVLCIEELDKFAKSERNALYEAMSEGEYEVNQADVRETYKAECRVVATANSVEKFADAIPDRFDFVIELDEYDHEETDMVTEQLYESWWETFIEGDAEITEPVLPNYLKWIETFEPGGEREALKRIQRMRQHIIHDGGFTGEIRTKEAYLRIAYTVAKLNRRAITPYDYLRAVELIHPKEMNGSLKLALKQLADGEELNY